MKTFDGLVSAGSVTPLRLTEMLLPEVPRISDGKRVAVASLSAANWSSEMLLRKPGSWGFVAAGQERDFTVVAGRPHCPGAQSH